MVEAANQNLVFLCGIGYITVQIVNTSELRKKEKGHPKFGHFRKPYLIFDISTIK